MDNDNGVVRRSLVISLGGRYIATILQFVSVMILSRILTPKEIGVYTVGLVLVNIAHMIRDLGIAKYIIQEKELTRDKVGAALTLAIAVAWSLGAIVMLCAPLLAAYVREPGVTEVARVVALNFFIIPLGSFAPAVLKRSMRFGTIFRINLAQVIVNVSVAILLAYGGYGYMSMAWASVAGTLVTASLSQFFLPAEYRSLPKLGGSLKILHFGKYVVSSNLLRELDAAFFNIMAGRHLGLAAVGHLSRAQGYEKIFSHTLEKGAEPVISANIARHYRNDSQLEETLSSTFNYVTSIGWFGLGFLVLMSSNMITLLYGDQWLPAIPLASVVCFTACFAIVTRLVQAALQATGQVKVEFYTKLIATSIRLLVVAVFIREGVMAVLMALMAIYALESMLMVVLIGRGFGLGMGTFLKTAVQNAGTVLLALCVPFYFYFTDAQLPYPVISELLVGGASSVFIWIALLALQGHPIAGELRSLTGRFAT